MLEDSFDVVLVETSSKRAQDGLGEALGRDQLAELRHLVGLRLPYILELLVRRSERVSDHLFLGV